MEYGVFNRNDGILWIKSNRWLSGAAARTGSLED